jgi:hypothetical protein
VIDRVDPQSSFNHGLLGVSLLLANRLLQVAEVGTNALVVHVESGAMLGMIRAVGWRKA